MYLWKNSGRERYGWKIRKKHRGQIFKRVANYAEALSSASKSQSMPK